MIAPIASSPKLFSGLYQGSSGNYRLDLRIDIDGPRPTMCVSGDFYEVKGQTDYYDNSFVVEAVAIQVVPGAKRLRGRARFDRPLETPQIEIDMPLAGSGGTGDLVFRFIDDKTGKATVAYKCQRASPSFRRVYIENDHVEGVVPFTSADTGVAQAAGARRGRMDIKRAFAEAGIEVVMAGSANAVATSGSGTTQSWSNAELYEAMLANYSIRSNSMTWRVYLLSATKHEDADLRGVMFDNAGRQGCATFHTVMEKSQANPATLQLEILRTYVHEIGHCFNLVHSTEKSLLGLADRPDALSWMNRPWSYPPTGDAGAEAYWKRFEFIFDEQELRHLRHALLPDIAQNGNGYYVATASDSGAAAPWLVANHTGLALTIRTPARVKLGGAVIVELKLARTAPGKTRADALLHPHFGRTRIEIRGPDGKQRRFRPLASHCGGEGSRQTRLPVHDSAYIGFGRDGFHFDWPGRYTIVATHLCTDGSVLVSNAATVTVEAPLDSYDAAACELFLGDEAGYLLALLGSDSPAFDAGRNAMLLAVDRFPGHRLTDQARLVLGINAARPFKRIVHDGRQSRLEVRPVETGTAIAALKPLVATAMDSARHRASLDHISLAMVGSRLGRIFRGDGRHDQSRELAADLSAHFRRHGISNAACDRIARDIAGRPPRPQSARPNKIQQGEEQ